ncbi:hypothetical protein GCM10011385_30200 [Nitratireductor aestuarii]|uniref:Uncharacterized protein n=1 Tax=Nitratireductor aestuarii TaxID=1735103 RepID=A0A916W7H1_9HYPH|nr:hypothetical protein [Nitratireductor aestuarii]GGA74160.1 hypothetical protein GCM10011385_30200 [Nitratireductor aestuarii]
MTDEFKLNDAQKQQLVDITQSNTSNYAAGYEFLRQEMQNFLDNPANAENPHRQDYARMIF